jgi:hypothetical protein
LIFLAKVSWKTKDIFLTFSKFINFEQLKYILISKKISFSYQNYKKIRSIKRRLKKRMVKHSRLN